MDLGSRVPKLLARHPSVLGVSLVGSRASGTETALSDWDFAVETDDREALSDALPKLMAPLEPLAQQWDPLGEHPTYMLMLGGPTKVDLIFAGEPWKARPPWRVSAETLPRIDAHFWDWILWLAAKRARSRDALVRKELDKLHVHLLGPLGVDRQPATIDEALDSYLSALQAAERRVGTTVSRELRDEVLPAVR